MKKVVKTPEAFNNFLTPGASACFLLQQLPRSQKKKRKHVPHMSTRLHAKKRLDCKEATNPAVYIIFL